EVVARGVEAEELAIEHVRQPGQRVPVGRLQGGEGPGHRLRVQTRLDVGVAEDVLVVVVVHEAVAVNGGVHDQGDHGQGQRHRPSRHQAWPSVVYSAKKSQNAAPRNVPSANIPSTKGTARRPRARKAATSMARSSRSPGTPRVASP